MRDKQWTADQINQMSRGYQAACVLAAAADLDLFAALSERPATAGELATTIGANLRGLTILLDALAALQLLDKAGEQYHVPPSAAKILDGKSAGNQLAMAQHQANCLRRWAQLGSIVKTGQLPPRQPSIRGEQADYASFIEAMDNVSGPIADRIVADLQPLRFKHLLDVGGGSGTWTLAFLRASSGTRATIFDLPQVIPQARERITKAGLADRVTLAAGDFYTDELPSGADLAWISAIVHQNSREQNRQLFARVFGALAGGGSVMIRDMVMEPSRTAPIAGALFAVNMLAGTPSGGTFTFDELGEDLASAGFNNAQLRRRDEGMHCVIAATKP